ncbi:MAG: type II toxin-antitoxin system mRNA interferase toxin, RelE/StbE family [bacterium]
MKIFYSSQFAREYQQLPVETKKKARKKEEIFRENPFNPILKTHKLKGKLDEFWAFSIDICYRIIFKFQNGSTVRFYVVGDHSIYKKL